ncbi:alpha/beta hydrolase (plasmid) [Rhizobium lusitanum]|uniref:alpha/beta fold hydrolase n=1 Tax=Rhizobium lusitanum TaxID=293958 RepID=UPI001614D8A0|nr:alpha/beta hydrolase [Rhizobium lusitanum]QND44337.1 alpha/beta hydrolase [Rhizobium lusitanum]
MTAIQRAYASDALGQLHYAEAGAGPALLLIGETPRSHRFFEPLLPLLAPTVRAIAVDLPGLGNSHGLPQPMSVRAIAACMVEFFDALGIERAHVFGMHTGNKVAAALAADWPERVDRLVLAGQTHSLFPETERRNAALAPSFARYRTAAGEPIEGDALREWLRTKLTLDTTWWPDALLVGRESARTIANAEARSIDFLLGWRSAVPIYHAVFALDLAEAVARIEAPSLVLELTTPQEGHYGLQGERLAGLMKHAMTQTIPVTFLAAMEEQTAEIADALLTFLNLEIINVHQ